MAQANYNLQDMHFYMQSFRQDLNPPQRLNSDNIKQAFVDLQITNATRKTLTESFDGVDRVTDEVESEAFDDLRLRGIIYKPTDGALIEIVAQLGFSLTGTWTKVTIGPDDHFRATIDITDILKAAVDHGWADGEKVTIFVSGPQGIPDATNWIELVLDWIANFEADLGEIINYEIEAESASFSLLSYEGALFQNARVKIEKDSLDAMANYHFDFPGQAHTPDLRF